MIVLPIMCESALILSFQITAWIRFYAMGSAIVQLDLFKTLSPFVIYFAS